MRSLVYLGIIFVFVGALIPTVVSPEVTVTDVSFESDASISDEDYTTYYDQLSESQRESLDTGVASDSLQEYISHQMSGNMEGKVITNSGVYVITGESDYGIYDPIVEYHLLGFLPGGLVMFYTILRSHNEEDMGEGTPEN